MKFHFTYHDEPVDQAMAFWLVATVIIKIILFAWVLMLVLGIVHVNVSYGEAIVLSILLGILLIIVDAKPDALDKP